MKKSVVLDFETAFKYPFNRAKGMFNILWLLLPIFGWFVLGGYSVRIVQEFSKGKFKRLPVMKFSADMKLGFFMFLKAIPFILVYSVFVMILYSVAVWLGILAELFIGIFMVPMLIVNFINKQTVESFFEFGIVRKVFDNIGDYFIAFLKDIILGIVFAVLIIILVGIPAGIFTKNIFLVDFYRRRVK